MTISYINVEETYKIILEEGNYTLVDTLPEEHFVQVHLPEALNICVYNASFSQQVAELLPEQEKFIIVYGSSDRTRTALFAAEKMIRAGYSRVFVLQGGLESWRQANYPLSGEATEAEFVSADSLEISDGAYTLNPEQSSIQWKGRNHNSSHYGTVDCLAGDFTTSSKAFTGSLSVAMDSIKNTNLQGDELQPVLEAHLKSDDFFFVNRYKTATLTIHEGRMTSSPILTQKNCVVQGDLTLRGKTKDIQFEATLAPDADGNLLLEAHFDLDRTRWNIIYGSARFFDFLGMHQVFDDISLELRLKLEKIR